AKGGGGTEGIPAAPVVVDPVTRGVGSGLDVDGLGPGRDATVGVTERQALGVAEGVDPAFVAEHPVPRLAGNGNGVAAAGRLGRRRRGDDGRRHGVRSVPQHPDQVVLAVGDPEVVVGVHRQVVHRVELDRSGSGGTGVAGHLAVAVGPAVTGDGLDVHRGGVNLADAGAGGVGGLVRTRLLADVDVA